MVNPLCVIQCDVESVMQWALYESINDCLCNASGMQYIVGVSQSEKCAVHATCITHNEQWMDLRL